MNIQKYIKLTFSIVLSVLVSFSVIYAWNWLVAEDGDVLDFTKWNQVVANLPPTTCLNWQTLMYNTSNSSWECKWTWTTIKVITDDCRVVLDSETGEWTNAYCEDSEVAVGWGWWRNGAWTFVWNMPNTSNGWSARIEWWWDPAKTYVKCCTTATITY